MSISHRSSAIFGLIVCGWLAAGCEQGAAPGTGAPETPAAEPASIADLFPSGPGRDQFLNNCAACHNIACSAIGQRTPDRWMALKESHKDKASPDDLDAIFAYLQTNFANTKPEPKVPPRFLEGGCTPF